MDKLRVRVYNVLFGDAILISVPDKSGSKTVTRHILIDVGNVLIGTGSDDEVFERVAEDIIQQIGKKPLDLYVMTHEHMDHVQGLLYVSNKHGLSLKVKHAWLTASAAEDYYETHPKAKEKKLEAIAAYESIERFLQASSETETPLMRAMRLNNDPRSTTDCVEYLRKLTEKPTYVYRGCDLKGKHPFREAKFEIWAPEEDTSEYYGSFQPVAFNVTRGNGAGVAPTLMNPLPPPGVDASAFYSLVESRRQGYTDNMLTIDKAINNTSVVFCLEWRDWRLLFPGDAEQRSWKTIWKTLRGDEALKPIHFLKVAHHGSSNGMPLAEMLDELMPEKSPDKRPRYAVVSTCLETYNNVPDNDTLKELGTRCKVMSTLDLSETEFYLDVEFEG
jgi:beta-lactamase superfamily II metal-dependent hydrolase